MLAVEPLLIMLFSSGKELVVLLFSAPHFLSCLFLCLWMQELFLGMVKWLETGSQARLFTQYVHCAQRSFAQHAVCFAPLLYCVIEPAMTQFLQLGLAVAPVILTESAQSAQPALANWQLKACYSVVHLGIEELGLMTKWRVLSG